MEFVTCKNCGTEYKGKYCNHCGQKATVGRIRWKTLWENLLASLTNVERGFFFTIWQLFKRPGHLMRDYLEGKRANYFKPFGMLFILVGTYAVLSEVVFPGTYEKALKKREEKLNKETGIAGSQTENISLLDTLAKGSLQSESRESPEEGKAPDSEKTGIPIDPATPGKQGLPVVLSDTLSPETDLRSAARVNSPKKQYDDDDDHWFVDTINSIVEVFPEDSAFARIMGNMVKSPLFIALYFLFSFILNIKWVFWKQARSYNLVEFFFIGAYIASQLLVFLILVSPWEYYFPDFVEDYNIKSFAFIGLVAWDYKQFFKMRWWPSIWRTVVLYLFAFLVMLLLLIFFALVIAGLAYLLKFS